MRTLIKRIVGGILGRGGTGMTKPEADRAVLDQLRHADADMDRPREVIHFFYFPTEEGSRKAAEFLRTQGYSVEVRLAADAKENPPNLFS